MILDEIVADKKKRLPGHMARIPETEMRRMAAEQIALIKESWSALLADVKAHYDNILSTEDLKNLTVNQLLELIEFSKSLVGKMEALFSDHKCTSRNKIYNQQKRSAVCR